jgi:hypothetical protein
MQHGGHPAGQVGSPPDALQAVIGVRVREVRITVPDEADQGGGEGGHVGDGEVEALRAGGRHDMGRVPGEEQTVVAHGRGDETAHRGDRLFQDRPGGQLPAGNFQPRLQLSPDAVVGPVGDVLVGGYLEVEAADLGRAHAVQGEAVVVAAVEHLVGGRRRLREDAKPAVRIGPFGDGVQPAAGDGRPADAVEAVATGDGVADDLVPCPGRVGVAEDGLVVVEPVNLGVADVEFEGGPVGDPGGDDVLDDLGLRVDRYPAAAGQLAEVHVVPFSGELKVDAVVLHALFIEPVAEPGVPEQLDGGRLEHAGPLPCFAVGPAPVLDDDGVDTAEC